MTERVEGGRRWKIVNFSGITKATRIGVLLRAVLRIIPKGLTVPILQGPNRGFRWIVGAGTHGCWLGSYEAEKQTALASMLGANKVFYDVGANVGFYTLLASRLVGPGGRVVSVEPVPRNISFLRRHVEINNCRNVLILGVAVSNQTGTGCFFSGESPSEGRLDESGGNMVQVETMDRLVHSGRIPPPDVIKMDIEGGEAKALNGARGVLLAHRPIVFLATHGSKVHMECYELLTALGYKLKSLDRKDVSQSSEIVAFPE